MCDVMRTFNMKSKSVLINILKFHVEWPIVTKVTAKNVNPILKLLIVGF